MTSSLPVVFTLVLLVLALFQLALAAGAPLGRFAWGGKHRVLPARLRWGSILSVVVYAIFAGVALVRGGVLQLAAADTAVVIVMWIIAAYLVLSILPNLASTSRPEKLVMTPVSAILAILALLIALG